MLSNSHFGKYVFVLSLLRFVTFLKTYAEGQKIILRLTVIETQHLSGVFFFYLEQILANK